MASRRSFLKNIGLHSAAIGLLPFLPKDTLLNKNIGVPYIPEELEGEDYWARIQESYTNSRTLINLNNGGVSPQPKFVQEAFELYNSVSNEAPAYQMWRILEPGRENIREDLAGLLGCEKEEVVINRNTTEALDTIIFGLDLEKGDEVVLSHYDYPNMRNAWEQRKKRDGLVLKYIELNLPEDSDELIVQKFVEAVNKQTKLVHITHMVNYNGQVLPADKIASAVKEKNPSVMVMLDGAHSFAHIPFSLKDIDCDFFGTSLHKWLCAPFGTGLMYIRKDRIAQVWPFFPTDVIEDNDIRKFEALGTRSIPTEIAVGQAILFHQNIGIDRKHQRLVELTNYWTNQFKDQDRFKSYNPKRAGAYGSLYTFGIEGIKGGEISRYLQKEKHVITSPIEWQDMDGCRVSPHIYSTFSDLDKLMEGISELIKK